MKNTLILLLACCATNAFAQIKMRPVSELLNLADPGWVVVQEWIDHAKNKVEVLHVDTTKAKDALYKIQVTTRSPMGAIVYSTGGILVEGGWIRILGSGSEKLKRSLPDWNKGKTFEDFGKPMPFLVIADDAVGGFFLLNGGGLGKDMGKIYYFSPDNLEYEPMEIGYSDFLNFCFNGDLKQFYADMRWKGWEKDFANLNTNQAFSFYPYLWTKEGKNINKSIKKVVPIDELFDFNKNMRQQLGIK